MALNKFTFFQWGKTRMPWIPVHMQVMIVMMDINNKGRFAKSFPSISSSNKLKSASAANTEQWGPNHKAYLKKKKKNSKDSLTSKCFITLCAVNLTETVTEHHVISECVRPALSPSADHSSSAS